MTSPTGHEADPHSQVRTTSQPCQVHKNHIPSTHINHRHHVWPKGLGGPDIEDNIIAVCATGHMNIHDLLSHYRVMMGNVPYTILRQYTIEERRFAKLGFDRMLRKAM